MAKRKYTEDEIDTAIRTLSEDFENSCEVYKIVLSKRDSNRSKKELLRFNKKGTNIHKFQSNFSWLLHDIKTGPKCFVEKVIEEANELILHIKNITNN